MPRRSQRLKKIDECREASSSEQLGQAENEQLGQAENEQLGQAEIYFKVADRLPKLFGNMALNAESSSEVKIYFSMLRERLAGVASPDVVAELESKVPTAPHWKMPAVEVLELLQKYFPQWELGTLVNLAGVMAGIGHSVEVTSRSMTTSSSSSLSGFLNFVERGAHALKSRIVYNLPEPLDDELAELIWPSTCWITDTSPGKSMIRMLDLLQKHKPKEIKCTFHLQNVSTRESVCGTKKPDCLLVLKGCHQDYDSTGAIICLHSKGDRSKYDSSECVGEAIHYGLKFLKNAGSRREFICVGITDLTNILWFRVSCNYQGPDYESEYCTHIPASGKVKQSLCAFLVADPVFLGLTATPMELRLPENWKWKRILGRGRTSVVHEIEWNGRKFALKSPKGGLNLANDFIYLKALETVDGIPCIHGQVGLSLLLYPVGDPFSLLSLKKFQMKKSLPQLVEILKAVHDLGYVNRDIRVENFMIAEDRLFILDWGFAAKSGVECHFAGCLYTASNDVLSQLQNNEEVTYRGVDDLVALVRCMRMFVDDAIFSIVMGLVKQSKGEALAKALMKSWNFCMAADADWLGVESKAKNGDYDGVKDFLRVLLLGHSW